MYFVKLKVVFRIMSQKRPGRNNVFLIKVSIFGGKLCFSREGKWGDARIKKNMFSENEPGRNGQTGCLLP